MNRRPPKKSETLEVRLSHEVKSALMRKAQTEGRSASEVIRAFIGAYLAEQPKEARSMIATLFKPAAALGSAAIVAIWAATAPAPLHAKPDIKAVFQALDLNNDEALTQSEFLQHTSNAAIRKLHESHKAQGHQGMAAMHGAAGPGSHARPPEQSLQASFAKLDSDLDGSVKYGEFQAFHEQKKASHGAH